MDLKSKLKKKEKFVTVSIRESYKEKLKAYCDENGFKLKDVMEALIDELNKEK